MKRIHAYNCALWVAVLFVGQGLSAEAATTVHFSVDMTPAITLSEFNPAGDQVQARGTFNGWATPGLVLTNDPGAANPNVYSGTLVATNSNPGKLEYKFWNSSGLGADGGWEVNVPNNQGWAGNRAYRLPDTDGGTVTLPTVFWSDAGPQETVPITFRVDMAQRINLGQFSPMTGSVFVRGSFNGWAGSDLTLSHDPSIVITNAFGILTTNVYVGTHNVTGASNSLEMFKYIYNNNDGGDVWESESTILIYNRHGNNQNRYFQHPDGVLPVVYFGDVPFTPELNTNTVTFQVDMTAQRLAGNFNPDFGDTVELRGDFNNWGSPPLMLTNHPAPNTNVYSGVVVLIGATNTSAFYKFVRINAQTAGVEYEGDVVKFQTPDDGGQFRNRLYLTESGVTVLPAIYFNEVFPSDLLPADTLVTFAVDMNGAVGTDGHTFNAVAGDVVYINGEFAGWYPWTGDVNPAPAPPQYELFDSGGGIYTNSFLLPRGAAINQNYRYGMGYDRGFGVEATFDNDTTNSVNRTRVVRSTATGDYTMPVDKFGTVYNEPYFSRPAADGGQLQVGPSSGGVVPVQWLGRPGAHLQSSASVTGPWSDHPETDGSNWSVGMLSTNGLLSVTNWPSSGNRFFRLTNP